MKYFAKYLPVEGIIGDGDTYLFEDKIQTCKVSVIKELEELYQQKIAEYQKVQLFLCSRDTQVGDEICVRYRDGNEIKIHGQLIYDGELPRGEWVKHISMVDKRYDFKVIGSISPQAIWVKEGDEFEDNDLEFVFKYIGDTGKDFEDIVNPLIFTAKQIGWGHNFGSIISKVIRIKCSQCKSFH